VQVIAIGGSGRAEKAAEEARASGDLETGVRLHRRLVNFGLVSFAQVMQPRERTVGASLRVRRRRLPRFHIRRARQAVAGRDPLGRNQSPE
jgi:hypothetical protein